jgi:oligosaccharyltransferase complex subunit beta
MRHLVIPLLLVLSGIVQALSSAGERLLVVLEEESEKASFSQFWADLEGV